MDTIDLPTLAEIWYGIVRFIGFAVAAVAVGGAWFAICYLISGALFEE